MIPAMIRSKLAALRRRERLLQIVWGAARVFVLFLVLVFLACVLDYVVDAYQETPLVLHVVILVGLLVSVAVAALLFFLPIFKELRDDELALWVEDRSPRLQHRLISTVQFSRGHKALEGMSTELAAVVTQETEKQTSSMSFTEVADHSRLKLAAFIIGPALILAVVPFLLWTELATTLLGRLFLANMHIARRVTLRNETAAVWPIGEKIQVKLKAKGSRNGEKGTLRVSGGDSVELKAADEPDALGEIAFVAEIKSNQPEVTFNAYVGDGRLPEDGKIEFVSRPAVQEVRAWVQLPADFGLRPNGMPYEKEVLRADPVGPPGSSAKVQVKLQKAPGAIKWVKIRLLGSDAPPPPKEKDDEQEPAKLPPEKEMRTLTMTKLPGDPNKPDEGAIAEVIFDMRKQEKNYEILVRDIHDFDNETPPRHKIDVVDESAPVVTLLREQFPPLPGFSETNPTKDDFELDGLPVPVGGPLRIAYNFTHPYGVEKATLWYRVHKKRESGNESVEERWLPYTLIETRAKDIDSEKFGRFDMDRGAFENSKDTHNIFFYAVPSYDPDVQLGRTSGGGRFIFHTKGIVPDANGNPTATPDVGDQIEYYVEVYAGKNRPSGKSAIRVKPVATILQVSIFLREALEEEKKIKNLRKNQEGVLPGSK